MDRLLNNFLLLFASSPDPETKKNILKVLISFANSGTVQFWALAKLMY